MRMHQHLNMLALHACTNLDLWMRCLVQVQEEEAAAAEAKLQADEAERLNLDEAARLKDEQVNMHNMHSTYTATHQSEAWARQMSRRSKCPNFLALCAGSRALLS